MKWFAAAILLLLAALAFGLSLPAYAMYALLGIMLVSRWLARSWIHIFRRCGMQSLLGQRGRHRGRGDHAENAGRLPVAWTLIEDLLPRRAFTYQPPSLQVQGKRIQLAMLARPRPAHDVLSVEVQSPRISPDRPADGRDGRFVRTAPPLSRAHVAALPAGLSRGRAAGGLRVGLAAADRRNAHFAPPLRRPHADRRRAALRGGRSAEPHPLAGNRPDRPTPLQSLRASCVVGATLLLDFHQAAFDPHHEPYRSELSVTAAASLANAVYEMDQQIGLVTNGRDAVDRIRQEGWDYDIRSRKAARQAAGMLESSECGSPSPPAESDPPRPGRS